MPTGVNIDGTIFPPEEARLSVFDHGFLYGDAVYETLRTHRRRPFLFSRHFGRLMDSAEALGLGIPWSEARLRQEVDRTLQAGANDSESLIRMIVTRGVGPLSPDPEPCRTPTVIILAVPLVELPAAAFENGVAITISGLRRDPQIAKIKSASLVHQVIGIREAKARGAEEAIFLSSAGHLSDGARSNIYLVRGGEVWTPSPEAGIIRGITRSVVLDVARDLGIRVVEGKYAPDLIAGSDEVFITSVTRGVLPVTRVDEGPVGDGRVGPVTRRLLEGFRTAVERLIEEDRPA